MDVKMAIDALAAPKPEGEDDGGEKVLILISSLLSWDATPKKLVEVRDPREIAAEEEALQRANEARIEQEIAKIRAERNRKRELAMAEMNSDEGEPEVEENTDEQDMKEALRIIAAEQAQKTDGKKERRQRKMLHLAFTEADYEMRKASEEYACIREAEDYVL